MKNKEFFSLLSKDEEINYAVQTRLLKTLMSKYKDSEIVYAVNYYKKKGLLIKSFGFLTYKNCINMEEPVSLYRAELADAKQGGNSSERNKLRIEHNSKTYGGKKHYFDLFEEPGEDN